MRAFAHSRPGEDESSWELLEDHLGEVGELAGDLGEALGLAAHARLVGLWHDLGKYSAEFQRMIRSSADASLEASKASTSRVDHSTCGAQHAATELGAWGRIPAWCIAGHHAGLADALPVGGSRSSLKDRLAKSIPSVPARDGVVEAPPPTLLKPPTLTSETLKSEIVNRNWSDSDSARAFQLAFACRMVFSALIDADSLCTESFYRPERSKARDSSAIPILELFERLERRVAALPGDGGPVYRSRQSVWRACCDRALEESGLFSLTVPTGGGKTFSGLGFALRHAAEHGLRRVICAIPFTSIIEQNAQKIRDALEQEGEHVVLEHHSALVPDAENAWSHMAAENWDAPIVVTTNVQLFDSLFANKRTRCRKLHNIAKSVIVLDEAQSLPVRVLEPCLAALRELIENYGCSVVLCTATQPAVERSREFPIGLEGSREIIEDVPSLFEALRRTSIEPVGPKSNDELTDLLEEHPRILCVVNTRAHAESLHRLAEERGTDGLFHLSARMCPAHRSEVLREIHAALDSAEPCRVVSTQVIEAGVDVDFPIVLRAMAGLDSIAQAAGRCNREGRLDVGRVLVFETDTHPGSEISNAAHDTRAVLPEHVADLISPDAISAYFSLHYWKRSAEWDQADVLGMFSMSPSDGNLLAQFRDAAAKFRVIDSAQTPILVPYGDEGRALVEAFKRSAMPDRNLMRRLQRFTVGVYDRDLAMLKENMVVSEHGDVYVLEQQDAYVSRGLSTTEGAGFDPMIS